MPRRVLDALNLKTLARKDPEAAAFARALNSPQGLDLDGKPERLTWDEFRQAGAAELQLNPAARPVLDRLAAAFHRPALGSAAAAPLVTAAALSPISGGGVSMPVTAFADPRGGLTSVVMRGDQGTVSVASSTDGLHFSPPVQLPVRTTELSGAVVQGERTLFAFTQGPRGEPQLWRSSFEHNDTRAVALPPLPGAPHWPQLTTLKNGDLVMGFVVLGQQPYLMTSHDQGRSFGPPHAIGHTRQDVMTLVHLATFGDGTLAVTTQVADPQMRVKSFVRFSTDGGATLSAPTLVTDQNQNVHDAFPITRRDGNVDLYYLREAGAGFEAWRRMVKKDGTLGPEQRLTGPDIGSVEKPQPRRLADGSLSVNVARRRPDAQSFDVVAFRLDGDAPAA